MPHRVAQLIPLLLLILVLVSGSLIFYGETRTAELSIREAAKQQLNLDITRLQNILYNRMIENDVVTARMSLSVSAMDQAIERLLLNDTDDRVLIANRYSWQGNQAELISRYKPETAADVKRTNIPKLYFPEDHPQTLIAYYPVVLGLDNQHGISAKQLGVLYAEYSIHSKLQAARNQAIKQSAIFFILMFLATLLVAVLLHFMVSKRLNALTIAARSFAQGELDAQVNVKGNDELGTLAQSFNDMTQNINQTIHKLENTEQKLRELNENLEARVEERTTMLSEAQRIAHLGNWVWHHRDDHVFWSDEIYHILAVDKESVLASMESMLAYVHPDDKNDFLQFYQHVHQSANKQIIEFRIIRPDNEERWLRAELIMLFNEQHKPEMYKGIVQDVTERKQERAQHDLLEKQLQQSQKMESLGQLTGGIAHDFNNMLAAIIGYTELARDLEVSDHSKKLGQYLDIVMQSSEKARDLVAQMLTFSRTQQGVDEKEKISISTVFDQTLKLLIPLLPSSIELIFKKPEVDIYIQANNVMLGQVIINLCLNARDAMENLQGTITIDVDVKEMKGQDCDSCGEVFSGTYAQVTIADNGSGIEQTVIEHLFEPFFTTKDVDKGTGMGLSMVHGIMHKHAGHIQIVSELNQGSEFILLFPVFNESEALLAENEIIRNDYQGAVNGSGKRILVVDDEVSIALYLETFLTEKGFEVVTLNDSQQALGYFTDNYKEIDLVLTDYTMPGLTGMQMAEAMHQIEPDFPILLCTGYSDQVNEMVAVQKGLKGYLEKPIDMKKLMLYIGQYAKHYNA